MCQRVFPGTKIVLMSKPLFRQNVFQWLEFIPIFIHRVLFHLRGGVERFDHFFRET